MRIPVRFMTALVILPALVSFAADPPPNGAPEKEATRKQINDLIASCKTDKTKATLGVMQECMDLSVGYGAPVWNQKDHEECCTFYIQTAQSLVNAFSDPATTTPLAAASVSDLKTALARVKDSKDIEKNAWVLRYAFDKAALACESTYTQTAGLLSLGTDYLNRNDIDDAQDAFSSAMALLPEMRGRDPDKLPLFWRVAPIAAANVLVAEKKYKEAAAAIAQGVEALPEWTQSKTDLRAVYGDPQILDALVSDLKAQARHDPNDANLQFLLGYENYFSGDRPAAKAYFEKALSLDPAHKAAKIFLDARPGPVAPPPGKRAPDRSSASAA